MASTSFKSETTSKYEPPSNTQFSVFLDNRVGKLNHLIELFNAPQLTLAGFSVIDAADHAVVRLLTSRAILAKRLLERHGLPFSQHDVLVVELTNGSTLEDICTAMLSAEININYVYPLLVRPRNLPALVIHADDITFASQLLRKRFFALLGENDLGDNATGNTPFDPDQPPSSGGDGGSPKKPQPPMPPNLSGGGSVPGPNGPIPPGAGDVPPRGPSPYN
ncbi:hypothetical protein [Poriferisphaera sp. WC338]|uniref:hypothetical protein n=1 Tax=Poriferisphaera sp. WC338 TaxID=3425129 RepID=UPI003D81B8FF